MVSVIGVGDNTVDRYLHLGKMFPGGNAVNVAVHARRMGCRAAYLGWIADDAHGWLVYDALKKEDVDISRCRLVSGQNAFCEVNLKDGDRVFGEYSEGVCTQIALGNEDLAFISLFDLVHTSVYSHLDSQLPTLSQISRFLSYDFSQEWDMEFFGKIFPHIQLALISNPDGNVISNEEIINFSRSIGNVKLLITSGQQGALFFDGNLTYPQEVIRSNKIVDTLGAGDAFAARFMVDYLNGIPVTKALGNAADAALLACMDYGAFGHGSPIYER